jgi:hypothetical protein
MLQLQAQTSIGDRVNFARENALSDNTAAIVVNHANHKTLFNGKYFNGQPVIIKSFHAATLYRVPQRVAMPRRVS